MSRRGVWDSVCLFSLHCESSCYSIGMWYCQDMYIARMPSTQKTCIFHAVLEHKSFIYNVMPRFFLNILNRTEGTTCQQSWRVLVQRWQLQIHGKVESHVFWRKTVNIHQRRHCDFHFGHDFRLPCHRKSPKVMATAAALEGGSAESAKWVGLNTGHEPNLWPFVNTSIMITVITGKLWYTATQVWTISNHVLSQIYPSIIPL